jgi:prolyl 4-hydroxylase
MKGRYFANIFVHFEPIGSFRKDKNDFTTENKFSKESLESILAGLPPYVVPGSPWESEWRTKNPEGWKLYHNNIILGIQKNDLRIIDNYSVLHHAARQGNLDIVKYLCERDVDVHALDQNGWSPIHEAVRFGDIHIVKFLQNKGGDMLLKTRHGTGESPYSLSVEFHGVDSELSLYLKELTPSEPNDEL